MTPPLTAERIAELRAHKCFYEDCQIQKCVHTKEVLGLLDEVERLRGMLNAAEDKMMQTLEDNERLRAAFRKMVRACLCMGTGRIVVRGYESEFRTCYRPWCAEARAALAEIKP